jgi:four helix bundle protein
MFNFEKRDVWQKAVVLADIIYSQTRSFPAEERFGLTNQMRRGVVSISSNIAEGSSRTSQADFARFIEIATGSVFEVTSQAFIAKKQGLLSEDKFRAIYQGAEELSRMLSGLRKSLSPT